MPISYAQALEDVLLFRALGSIKQGFYIDVGANDPINDSITRMFYDLGWSGINIEASPTWFAKIAADRTRDINLNVAASDRTGEITFHEIVGTGLSTVVEDFAERHVAGGYDRTTFTVKCDTLAAICERHVQGEVHFLKIDVEGAEEAVLRGADFSRHRPWIILVEATEPLSTVQTHVGWDHLVTEANYEFVLFDGLNRFYVANERPDLKAFFHFKVDDYQRATSIWTQMHWQNLAQRLEGDLARVNAELRRVNAELNKTIVQRAKAGMTNALSHVRSQIEGRWRRG